MSQLFSQLRRSFRLAPVFAALLLLTSCVCTMAPKAAALMPRVNQLLQQSKVDPYSKHAAEIEGAPGTNALTQAFQRDINAAAEKPECAPRLEEYRIWSTRVASFLQRWQASEPNPMNPAFVDEAAAQIQTVFQKVK